MDRKVVGREVVKFIADPLWDEARWSATTFRWHPDGEQPPIMGLCFENAGPAHEIFSNWIVTRDNADALGELRISIIEGEIPGLRSGYTVHISADPEGYLARATMEGIVADPTFLLFASRVNRMYPVAGTPPLLPNFKRDYRKHKEFMLAPVTRRADGQFWVDLEFGIIKTSVTFRQVSEIAEGDVDSVVLQRPRVNLQ